MNRFLETQLAYVPAVMGTPVHAPVVVIGGMGGSALPAMVLRFLGAHAYVIMHRDYDLPDVMPEGAACIAVSYSGETEETLSFAHAAIERGMPLSVVTTGGALLEFAQEHALPYVQVPKGAEPRNATIALTKALLALIGEDALLSHATFDGEAAEAAGRSLAGMLTDTTPIFYASGRNEALSYIAKIQCNETAKVPAFSNVFPELNHNEMQGFGTEDRDLLHPLVMVSFLDALDDRRVARRMELTAELLKEHRVRVAHVELPKGTRAEIFLYGWWLMRTCAHALAERSGISPDGTPLIAAFKEML